MSVVYERLARRIRGLAIEAQAEDGTGAERFKVIDVSPFRIEAFGSDLILEDGDPDFTVGSWIRQFMAVYPLSPGDEVWCLREGVEWHLVDLVGPVLMPSLRPLRGVVTNTVADAGDVLDVTAAGGAYAVPPGQWKPDGGDLPVNGAVCLVEVDHLGNAWVVAWSNAVVDGLVRAGRTV